MINKEVLKKVILIIMFLICVSAIIITAKILLENSDKEITNTDKDDIITEEMAYKYLEENYDNFNIGGSDIMEPLHQALNDKFSKQTKTVEHFDTKTSFNLFINGEYDVLFDTYIDENLMKNANENNIKLSNKPITKEAFIFMVSDVNEINNLSTEQLKSIFSGKITDYRNVGGSAIKYENYEEYGNTVEISTIEVFQRKDNSSVQMYMNMFMKNELISDKLFDNWINALTIDILNFNSTLFQHIKNGIGYNFYTYTDSQFPDNNKLISIDGIYPTDESIKNDTYPLVTTNNIYYDENNKKTNEFVENLYIYLMSDDGKELISNAGYLTIEGDIERNKKIENIEKVVDSFDYYNKESEEFYYITNKNKLLTYNSYSDFVLANSEFVDNENAKNYIKRIFNSGYITPYSYADATDGNINITQYWFDMSYDLEDIVRIKYNDLYYEQLIYNILENKFILTVSNYYYPDLDNYGFKFDDLGTNDLEISSNDLSNVKFLMENFDEKVQVNSKMYKQIFK